MPKKYQSWLMVQSYNMIIYTVHYPLFEQCYVTLATSEFPQRNIFYYVLQNTTRIRVLLLTSAIFSLGQTSLKTLKSAISFLAIYRSSASDNGENFRLLKRSGL